METTSKQNSNQFLCLLLWAIKDLTPCWKLKTKIWKISKDNKNKSLLKLHPFVRITHVVTRGVCHMVAMPFTLKSILRQTKNYENSNISPCENIIFKKNPPKETKILQDIITLQLISSFNTSQNITFQKSSHKK